MFYQVQGGARQVRQHVWGAGLAAVSACVGAAMADVEDTPQRAAARSAVALAMERWGCRTNPNGWEWGHLAEALEAWLRTQKCKQLGEAWMLATCLLEQEEGERYKEEADMHSKWTRDFAAEKTQRWGRWYGEAPEGDPLHSEAEHWISPTSMLISEPVDAGGLGLEPEPHLLHAGIVAVGHMSRMVMDGVGGQTCGWCSFEAARRRWPRLPGHGAAEKAWKRQLERLQALQVEPAAPERRDDVGVRDGDEAPMVGGGLPGASGGGGLAEMLGEVDLEAVERTLKAMEEPEVRRRRTEEVWKTSIQRCFPGVQRRGASEWKVGGCNRGGEAAGARWAFVMDDARTCTTRGGQARWLKRRSFAYKPQDGDEPGIWVGDDGWAAGHLVTTELLLRELDFDDAGRPIGRDGTRLDTEAISGLPPALQAQARASKALLDSECEVIDQWPTAKALKKQAKGGKATVRAGRRRKAARKRGEASEEVGDDAEGFDTKKPHINLAVQQRNRRELAMWQARIRATAVYTVDGSRDVFKVSEDSVEYRTARAAARHDGQVFGGRMHEPEGADNYLAELAGLIDAADAEDVGGRVIIVFDCTGGPLAMRQLMRASNRRRQGKHMGRWLEALLRFLDRQEVVVFLWQTSHAGSPLNEWADMAAAQAIAAEVPTQVPRLPCQFASMQAVRPRRSVHEWAAELAERLVRRRLKEVLINTQVHEIGSDVPTVTLPDETQRTCDAVLSLRCQMGDKRKFAKGVRQRMGPPPQCPFGCKAFGGAPATFDWEHVQFECQQCEIVEDRRKWVEEADVMSELLADGAHHAQWSGTLHRAKEGLPTTRQGQLTPRRRMDKSLELLARRLVGGLMRITGDPSLDRSKQFRAALTVATVAAARVQETALRLVSEREQELNEQVRAVERAGKYARLWRRNTREAGPARVAALRALYHAAGRVQRRAAELFSGEELEDRCAEVSRCVAAAAASVRQEHPRSARGGEAYQHWRILMLCARWRLIAAARYRRWELAGVAGEYCTNVRRTDEEARRIGAIALGEDKQYTLPVPSTWPSGLGVDEPGGLSLVEREQEAASRFMAGGGLRAEARRRKAAKTLALQRQAAVMSGYRGQGLVGPTLPGQLGRGRAVVGISGNALSPVGGRIEIVIEERQHGRMRRLRGLRAASAHAVSDFEAGKVPNRFKMWKYERILEVLRSNTRREQVTMRVRWFGVNPRTQLPWRDSWVDAAWGQTEAAKCEIDDMLATRYGEGARRMVTVARKEGAALAPEVRAPEWQQRWEGLRSSRRAAGGGQEAGAPAKKARRVEVSDDEEEGSDEGEAESACEDDAMEERGWGLMMVAAGSWWGRQRDGSAGEAWRMRRRMRRRLRGPY
jgi:ribonuclease HI